MLTDAAIEELARRIHLRYRKTWHILRDLSNSPPTSSDLIPNEDWDSLSDETRENNRGQARDIEDKLMSLGWIVCGEDELGALNLTRDDIEPHIEELARAEHNDWERRKRLDGWQYAPERDDSKKLHDLLKPYDQLTDAQQELDRDPVRAIPELLASAGLAVQRLPAN